MGLRQTMEDLGAKVSSLEETLPTLPCPATAQPDGHRNEKHYQGEAQGVFATSRQALAKGEFPYQHTLAPYDLGGSCSTRMFGLPANSNYHLREFCMPKVRFPKFDGEIQGFGKTCVRNISTGLMC